VISVQRVYGRRAGHAVVKSSGGGGGGAVALRSGDLDACQSSILARATSRLVALWR